MAWAATVQPYSVGGHHGVGHGLGIALEVSGGGGVVGAAAERFGDGGGAAEQRAVEEDLDGAQREPVVAEAGAHAEVEAEGDGVVGVRGERVQHVGGGHHLGPGVQRAAVAGELVGGELHRAVPDPAAADAGLGEARDALGEVVPGGGADGVSEGGHGVRQHLALHELLRGLFEESVGPSVRVPGDDAAGRIGEPVGERAGLLQNG